MPRPTLPNVVVPDGHAVETYSIALGPSVHQSSGGLLIAQLGYVGDDYDAVGDVFDRVNDEVARWGPDLPRATVANGRGTLRSLFAPSEPATCSFSGGIIWTSSLDGLDAMLADVTERERLVRRFLGFSRCPQWLIVESLSASVECLLQQLRALGVVVFRAGRGEPFLVEVRRPDHRWISSFARTSAIQSFAAALTASEPLLVRAPRMRRLLLEATARGTSVDLYDELVRRQHKLPFLCGAAGQVAMMQWPQCTGPFLPVFVDLEWVERALRELGPDVSRTAIGWLRPRELLAWAQRDRFGLALAAFPDAKCVHYWPIDPRTVASLLWRMS